MERMRALIEAAIVIHRGASATYELSAPAFQAPDVAESALRREQGRLS
jgi:hypothetical protein